MARIESQGGGIQAGTGRCDVCARTGDVGVRECVHRLVGQR